MPNVEHLSPEGFDLRSHGYAFPANLTRLNGRQATQHAYKAGFSNSVCSRHVEPAPSFQTAINVLTKGAPPPATAQLVDRQYGCSSQFWISHVQHSNLKARITTNLLLKVCTRGRHPVKPTNSKISNDFVSLLCPVMHSQHTQIHHKQKTVHVINQE